MPFVTLLDEVDCGEVTPAIVVEPDTEMVPPAKVPLASLVNVAGAPALVCVKSGLVTTICNPCVAVAVVEIFKAEESEIELPTTFNPTVPKTVKSGVVMFGIIPPGGEIAPKSKVTAVPVAVKTDEPPTVVIVPSWT